MGLTGTLKSSGVLTGFISSGQLSGVLTASGNLTCSIAPTSEVEPYDGETEVTPKVDGFTLETKGLQMASDITIKPIPYGETSNLQDGLTVFIADEV